MILALITGDHELKEFYIALYERYGAVLRRRCERVLNSRADAEDLVHGLFADLIQKRMRDVDFSYLYRAATNRCITFIHSKNRRSAILERQVTNEFEYRYQLDDKIVDLQLLSLLVQKLDRKSCEVLMYHFIDNMTQIEIAAMMGITRRTVNNYLRRIETAAAKVDEPKNRRRPADAEGVK